MNSFSARNLRHRGLCSHHDLAFHLNFANLGLLTIDPVSIKLPSSVSCAISTSIFIRVLVSGMPIMAFRTDEDISSPGPLALERPA